jgi:hypothetical protein
VTTPAKWVIADSRVDALPSRSSVVVGARRQLALQAGHLVARQRLQFDQAVDEQAQAARRRHAASRGMRRGHQAGIFEIGHDVADRRRAHVQPGRTRQRARAHRLAVDQILGNQRAQQASRACIEIVAVRVDHAL